MIDEWPPQLQRHLSLHLSPLAHRPIARLVRDGVVGVAEERENVLREQARPVGTTEIDRQIINITISEREYWLGKASGSAKPHNEFHQENSKGGGFAHPPPQH